VRVREPGPRLAMGDGERCVVRSVPAAVESRVGRVEVCEQQGDDAVDRVTRLREHTCIGKESELLISLIGLVDL